MSAGTAEHPWTSSLEAISKATALFALIVYVAGFLVTSIYNASFGFSELSPFRPRIIAAGALFVFFTVLPAAGAYTYFLSSGSWWTPRSTFARHAIRALSFFIASAMLAVPSQIMFAPPRIGRWAALLTMALLLSALTLLFISQKRPVVGGIAAIAILTGALVITAVTARQGSMWARVTLWVFAVGLLTAALTWIGQKERAKRGIGELPSQQMAWGQVLFVIAFFVAFFPRWIYTNITSSWGGGRPIPVVMYFTPQSPILPGAQLPIQLLEQSDAGFYLVRQGERRALFVPRSAVAAVYYADTPFELPSPQQVAAQPAPHTPESTAPANGEESPKSRPRQH